MLRAKFGPRLPSNVIFTDRSNAVFLVWFSVLVVLVSVPVLFSHSACLEL